MKCSSCGLPLSPSRITTNCPRCGTPNNARQKAAPILAQQQYQRANWEHIGVVEAGSPPQNYQWAQNIQAPPLPETPQQPSQARQLWLPGPVSQPGFSPGPSQQKATPPLNSSNTRLGFVVAGACVLAGAILLIFVYFLAIGLPGSNSHTTATTTSTSHTSTPTTATTISAALSPTTPSYPGQQYINNAQMTSALDPNSMQPTQLTTTFKSGQKIYVTFQVHPSGHSGAVCLVWYLNNKQVINFNLPVSANSKHSYAYSIYGGSGSAYVELSWASTTKCTDQVLAKHLDFTVTN
jgi:hypothetical protein